MKESDFPSLAVLSCIQCNRLTIHQMHDFWERNNTTDDWDRALYACTRCGTVGASLSSRSLALFNEKGALAVNKYYELDVELYHIRTCGTRDEFVKFIQKREAKQKWEQRQKHFWWRLWGIFKVPNE